MGTRHVVDGGKLPRPHRRSDTVHLFEHADLDKDAVRGVSRVTWVGVAVNVFLAVAKTVGGLLASSSVLLADAVHTVSDLATDAAVLIGVRYWSAPADAEHPHGHGKIETMITLAIGLALGAVGLTMGYEAVTALARSMATQPVLNSAPPALGVAVTLIALIAAFISIVAKELLYRWTVRKGIELESSAVVANAWHHRSDAFSSIPAVLAIGGEAMGRELGYDLWYLDPIGTVIVCVMLLQAAWEVMSPALGALLDASADRELCSAIRRTVLGTTGVIDAHCIRTRVIGSNAVEVNLHIEVDKDLTVGEGHRIAANVKYRILRLRVSDKARPVDVMVHVEPAESTRAAGDRSDTMMDWKLRS